MMSRILALTVGVVLACATLSAQAAENIVVFGPNQDLAAGAMALQVGNYDEGVRLTRRGLKIEKSSKDRATGLSNLCAGLVGLRLYAEALVSCDQSLALKDRNWHVYNNRALAFLGLGRVERARMDMNRGLELKPGAGKLLKVAEMINARAAPMLAEATD